MRDFPSSLLQINAHFYLIYFEWVEEVFWVAVHLKLKNEYIDVLRYRKMKKTSVKILLHTTVYVHSDDEDDGWNNFK